MVVRNLQIVSVLLFTIFQATSCMKTDYTGKWQGEYKGVQLDYDLKMESYTLTATTRLDSATDIRKYKGVIFKDADTLIFVQSMMLDPADGLWKEDMNGKSQALYRTMNDSMVLYFSRDTLRLKKVEK